MYLPILSNILLLIFVLLATSCRGDARDEPRADDVADELDDVDHQEDPDVQVAIAYFSAAAEDEPKAGATGTTPKAHARRKMSKGDAAHFVALVERTKKQRRRGAALVDKGSEDFRVWCGVARPFKCFVNLVYQGCLNRSFPDDPSPFRRPPLDAEHDDAEATNNDDYAMTFVNSLRQGASFEAVFLSIKEQGAEEFAANGGHCSH
jgi:hypothetical protein